MTSVKRVGEEARGSSGFEGEGGRTGPTAGRGVGGEGGWRDEDERKYHSDNKEPSSPQGPPTAKFEQDQLRQ